MTPHPVREYDDRWLADAVTRLRVTDAVAGLEREYDIACCAVSRGDVERALGRPLSAPEWERARQRLRDRRDERVAQLVDEALRGVTGSGPDGDPQAA